MKKVSIAIDGPSGAGKSTIARAVAKEFGFIYVDTGAIYRALGLYAVNNGVSPADAAGVEAFLPKVQIKLAYMDGLQHVFLNGTDVSGAIREHAVSEAASKISAIPAVRAFLLNLQRDMAEKNSVVMDGRDIGTVILPNADLKIFLTASPEERAKRRHAELLENGQKIDYDTVLADIKTRDHNDSTRAEAPLKQAEDAVLVDTTDNNLEQSIAIVINLIKEKIIHVF